MRIKFIYSLVFICINMSIFGKENSNISVLKENLSFYIGTGMSNPDFNMNESNPLLIPEGFINLNIGVCSSFNYGKLTLNAMYNIETIKLFTNMNEYNWNFSILYGPELYIANITSILSAGISINGGLKRGEYISEKSGLLHDEHEKDYFITLGIPLDAKLLWNFKNIAFGINGFINFNRIETFGGVGLILGISPYKTN